MKTWLLCLVILYMAQLSAMERSAQEAMRAVVKRPVAEYEFIPNPNRSMVVTENGQNALHRTCLGGTQESIEATECANLIRKGVSALQEDSDGYTPLDVLAQRSYLYEACEFKLIAFAIALLEAGANPHTKNRKTQKSSLDLARSAWQVSPCSASHLLKTLLKAYTQPSHTNGEIYDENRVRAWPKTLTEYINVVRLTDRMHKYQETN